MLPNSIPLKESSCGDSHINAENLGIIPYNQKNTAAERKLYTARSGLLDRPLNWMSGELRCLKKVAVEKKNLCIGLNICLEINTMLRRSKYRKII
jgi:hypothetical protein